jgi:hypothetical protein
MYTYIYIYIYIYIDFYRKMFSLLVLGWGPISLYVNIYIYVLKVRWVSLLRGIIYNCTLTLHRGPIGGISCCSCTFLYLYMRCLLLVFV